MMGKVCKPKDRSPVLVGRDSKENLWAQFSLAVYDSWKKESDFFNLVAFGKQAEIIEKFLNGGMWLGVSGRMKNKYRQDKDSGMTYCETSFIVEAITLPPKSDTHLAGDLERRDPTADDAPL